MTWSHVLIGALLLLLLGFLFIPVRIFALYLRENNNVQFTATIKAGPWAFRLREGPDPGRSPIRPRGKGLLLFRNPDRFRSLMWQIHWTRFVLELSFGTGDPALNGILAGMGWGAGSFLLARVKRFLRCKTTPKLTIIPVFTRQYFRVRWEGEFSLPLLGWLRLMLAMIKAEVLTVGKPPH